MHIDLTKKTVLVTGASRGIGRAIAQQLAEAGASVAAHFNKSQEDINALTMACGKGANAFQANLAVEKEVIHLFEKVLDHYGRLDAIVNNAGIAISSGMEVDDEDWSKDWHKTMAVNLNATAILCKKAINHFSKNNGGHIINITSRAAFRGDTAEYMAYAASKGGLVALTRSIARAFGKAGIKAFNVAPGFVKTEMAQAFVNEYGEDMVLNDIALNELTKPKDVAPMVVFLLSGMADHATGCTIDINAGSYVH